MSWVPEQGYKFDGNSLVDTSDLEKEDSLKKMTYITRPLLFQVEKDKGNIELFGHSNCGCWGLVIT